MGARDYQPASHRFLTPDSRNDAHADLGLSLNPATSNRYGFAGGTPASNVAYTPPFDLKRALASLAAGLVVGIGVTALAALCPETGLTCVALLWMAGGAAGAAASYGVDVGMDPNRSFNAGEFALNTTFGAVLGLATFGIAGPLGSRGAFAKMFSKTEVATTFRWTSWTDAPKTIIKGREYAMIGGRPYSMHAVNRIQPSGLRYSARPGPGEGGMTGGRPQIFQVPGSADDYGRSVPPFYVEVAVRYTRGVPQPNTNISYRMGTLQVITNDWGAVVSVITH
jgi:hypothetical protein